MTKFVLILSMFFMVSCHNRTSSYTDDKKDTLFQTDLDTEIEDLNIETGYSNIDSILHDLSIKYFDVESSISKHELMDLNYDNFNDLVVYRFGNGTGALTIIDVYYYNPQIKQFLYNRQLSEITNPSFYLSDSLITGFYIGHGGGNGISLKWNGKNWKTYESISIESSVKNDFCWDIRIKNHQTKTIKDTTMDLFVVPDTVLLKNEY